MDKSTKQRVKDFLANSDYVAGLLVRAMEAADIACDLTEDETTELFESTWTIEFDAD